MKRFTKFRRFMPGSPLWQQEQERIAAEEEAAKAKPKKTTKKSTKKSTKK
jgi:hypothetical protein